MQNNIEEIFETSINNVLFAVKVFGHTKRLEYGRKMMFSKIPTTLRMDNLDEILRQDHIHWNYE